MELPAAMLAPMQAALDSLVAARLRSRVTAGPSDLNQAALRLWPLLSAAFVNRTLETPH